MCESGLREYQFMCQSDFNDSSWRGKLVCIEYRKIGTQNTLSLQMVGTGFVSWCWPRGQEEKSLKMKEA